MAFKFSAASEARLEGVSVDLQQVADRALSVSSVDFGITCGLRTQAEQDALFERGATQTRRSQHTVGHAVDVAAWVDGAFSWEHRHYANIAIAFAWAAVEKGCPIRWGAAWTTPDIRFALARPDGLVEARRAYVEKRTKQGRKPFVDAVHFELAV